METTLPTTTAYEHVQLDANGIPIIAGTTMKVIELVMAQIAYGWSPEELHFQHPYLTLGQIHSALAYYWDHKETLDADIERRWQWAEQARRNSLGLLPPHLVVVFPSSGVCSSHSALNSGDPILCSRWVRDLSMTHIFRNRRSPRIEIQG